MVQDVDKIFQKLNLKWYKDDDQYSDGDIENDIMEYVCQNEPEDYGNKQLQRIIVGRHIIILHISEKIY